MVSASMLSLGCYPKINLDFGNKYRTEKFTTWRHWHQENFNVKFYVKALTTQSITSRNIMPRKKFSGVKASADSRGSGLRGGMSSTNLHAMSQSLVPFNEMVSSVIPTGVFILATFVLWKLMEKIIFSKPSKFVAEENKPAQGLKWSFAPGMNLLSPFGVKIKREAKPRLNDFAKELRSLPIVDMSGRNFGDEGLFVLAESLAYNHTAEEVSFAYNGITADGIKAFDGILQSNIALKTLNLSGNSIGDEGVKSLCDILVTNSSIQKLQLSRAEFGDEGAKAIAKMLKKNSTLLVIELDNNLIDHFGFSSLAGALLENNSISSIYLNGNYGGPLGAAALAKGLEGNKSLRGAERMADALKQNRSVTTVNLGENYIHAKGITEIAQVLKDNSVVTALEIGYNPIGPEGAKALAEVLKGHGNVKELMLGWCQIGANGAEHMADMLKYNSTISSLDLSSNGLRDEDDGAFAIAQAVKANEDVRPISLNLMDNLLTKLGQGRKGACIQDVLWDLVYEMNEKEVDVDF
ncbi:hypothetical protein BUALT_Bualt17G0093700 [Buddleja alternifolia]|uniref:Uncharacterized protein n=1 Tax=Buddleja alternifolia TaxID=168488 RepID=A0AAV6WHV1_9LAMI|nr:hypothetical protein BUALT_Bualt17G0093700 [Buddleja alternifolia]